MFNRQIDLLMLIAISTLLSKAANQNQYLLFAVCCCCCSQLSIDWKCANFLGIFHFVFSFHLILLQVENENTKLNEYRTKMKRNSFDFIRSSVVNDGAALEQKYNQLYNNIWYFIQDYVKSTLAFERNLANEDKMRNKTERREKETGDEIILTILFRINYLGEMEL